MNQEPTCVRDMLWIDRQRTSSVRVRYESGELPSPGALCNTETNVLPDPCKDVVKIEKVKYYYDTPLRQGGWSLRTELDTVETLTFEEFKQSKWWETYLQRVSKHNCDSSWMDYCNTLVDEDGCIAQFKIPEYKTVWWCSSDIPSGNVITCEVCVSYDGTVCVTVDKQSTEFEVSEIVEKLRKLEALERSGVSLDDNGNIVIKVNNTKE